MSLLSLRGVCRDVHLPDGELLQILTGVDLDVAPGEHVVVVGRSVSGKSTVRHMYAVAYFGL